ncbi:MAG: radical SAM protein [Kiritimatiellia bacterium]
MDRQWTRRRFLQTTGSAAIALGLAPILRAWAAGRGTGFWADATSREDSMEDQYPSYLGLHRRGELRQRAEELWDQMKECRLCPRECGAKRLDGKQGFCRAPGSRLVISSFGPHFGEERPLVGRGGSGTIFFCHCNLRCIFCQNWEISHLGLGSERSIPDLARMMLALQNQGCHNVNVVTPTHYLPHILKALDLAAGQGLKIPIVFNTCGWEKPEVIGRLDGIVDIYLPDIKYADGDLAAKYSSGARTYPEITRKAVLEMQRQVGMARTAPDGIMLRGLMIRHLVMPNCTADSFKTLEWIAAHLPHDTYVNLMAQYNPCYKAFNFPEIARRLTSEEYRTVVRRARDLGLTNLDIQGGWWL